VVDDDARLAASLRRALAYEGHAVEIAADGPPALVAARDRPPDLVVLDVMPGRRVEAGLSADDRRATLTFMCRGRRKGLASGR
jgi:DNA-binding response OmpR family regulator